MVNIFPSLICAELSNIENALAQLDPYVAGYHIDIMDSHFVKNIGLERKTVQLIRSSTDKTLYIHLMVKNPEEYFDIFNLHKGDIIAIHPESSSDFSLSELASAIISYGFHPSLAIQSGTPIESIQSSISSFNHILLMSVIPGFSGQQFIPIVFDTLHSLKKLQNSSHKNLIIGVDGGINLNNAPELIRSGAQQLMVGSALFSSKNPLEEIKKLSNALKNI